MKIINAILLGLFLVLPGVGCGPPPKEYDFHSGQGLVKGELPKGVSLVVNFLPDGDTDYASRADVGADGKFRLTSHFSRGKKSVEGVPAGVYRVRLTVPNSTKEIGPPQIPDKITLKASDPAIEINVAKAP